MSDFCDDPIQFTLQLAPKDKDIQEASVYYLSCEGQNPNYEYVYDADYSIRWVNYYVQDVVMQDCNNPSLQAAVEDFNEIVDEHVVHIEDYASCQNYYEIWNHFVDDGICTDVFGGLYVVWIAQTVTAICLCFCTIVGIRLIPLLEKIDRQKFQMDDSKEGDEFLYDADSSHHSVELMNQQRSSALN